MELHGRQSLTKRMLVFQQFMDSDLSLDENKLKQQFGCSMIGHQGERAVALFCTDIAARGWHPKIAKDVTLK